MSDMSSSIWAQQLQLGRAKLMASERKRERERKRTERDEMFKVCPLLNCPNVVYSYEEITLGELLYLSTTIPDQNQYKKLCYKTLRLARL